MPRTVDFMRNTSLHIVEKHSNYDIIPNCIWAPQKGANMGIRHIKNNQIVASMVAKLMLESRKPLKIRERRTDI